MSYRARQTVLDLVAPAAMFLAVACYLAAFPPSLGKADESYFLLEASRIRNGEVLYRDIFQFVTPLASYTMALLFWAFGTTIQTAKFSTAILHAATCVALYAACRGLGVRRSLSAATVIAYLAVGPPNWPFASWHWFATFVSTLLFACLLATHWTARGSAVLLCGLLVGLLSGIQQQKGLVFAAAVALLFAVDPLLDRRFAQPKPAREGLRRLLYFTAGVLLIAIPILLACIYSAGAERVFDDLVRFPLQTYRVKNHIGWGQQRGALGMAFRQQSFPTLMRWAPLTLLPVASRAIWLFVTGRERQEFRRLTALVVFAFASIASISYFPDYIHIAFIAPVFAACAAQGAEWVVAPFARRPWIANAIAWLLTGAVVAAAGLRLNANLAIARGQYPYEHDTAFGRVAFPNKWEPLFMDYARERLREAGTNEIFSYPNVISPYLLIGARNPTPYQFLLASFSPPEQIEKTLAILKERNLPYVIFAPLLKRPGDPIIDYLQKHYAYASVPEVERLGVFPSIWLFKRKPSTPPPSP